jgi:hypothetical protein
MCGLFRISTEVSGANAFKGIRKTPVYFGCALSLLSFAHLLNEISAVTKDKEFVLPHL